MKNAYSQTDISLARLHVLHVTYSQGASSLFSGCTPVRSIIHELKLSDYLYRRTTMAVLSYTALISPDPAHNELFPAKVCVSW